MIDYLMCAFFLSQRTSKKYIYFSIQKVFIHIYFSDVTEYDNDFIEMKRKTEYVKQMLLALQYKRKIIELASSLMKANEGFIEKFKKLLFAFHSNN
jgi:hypothetical protein